MSLGIAVGTIASCLTAASPAEDLGEGDRASTTACSADLFNAGLGEGIARAAICVCDTMVKDDAGVCAPDPLPDATVSFPSMRSEVVPDRARDCEPLRPTPDEVTIAADSIASDPEEKEEATPLVLDDGSPPSIAAKAALFEVPPLLEFSRNRAVPALLSVDISPSGGMLTTTYFPLQLHRLPLQIERSTADNLRNPRRRGRTVCMSYDTALTATDNL